MPICFELDVETVRKLAIWGDFILPLKLAFVVLVVAAESHAG